MEVTIWIILGCLCLTYASDIKDINDDEEFERRVASYLKRNGELMAQLKDELESLRHENIQLKTQAKVLGLSKNTGNLKKVLIEDSPQAVPAVAVPQKSRFKRAGSTTQPTGTAPTSPANANKTQISSDATQPAIATTPTPKKTIAFFAVMNETIPHPSEGYVLRFGNPVVNEGNMMSSHSSGYVRCKEDGTYFFDWTITVGSDQEMIVEFVVNGHAMHPSIISVSKGDHGACHSNVIVELQHGDEVWLRVSVPQRNPILTKDLSSFVGIKIM